MAEEQKFKCPVCGKEFDTKDAMTQHRKDAHPATEVKTKKPLSKGKIITYAIIAVVVLAIAGIGYWAYTNSKNNPGSISTFNLTLIPFEGNSSANINVVEFGDYQCPYCAAFATQAEPQMITNYMNSGKAKFYFMGISFLGQDSTTLAQGSWCANEQGLYYKFHDYVYANQGAEETGWATPNKVKAFAMNIAGLNVTQFSSCLDSNKYQSQVQQLTSLASNSGVTGTPTFFIGNNNIGYVILSGNEPYSTLSQTIDSQLAKV